MLLSKTTMQDRVSLRAVREGDEAFLFEVYASTRQEELAQIGWGEPQRERFLRMQFEAQRRSYESDYPGANFQIILVEGQPAGRLYVHRREHEIRIMDIALLPQYRNQGIGTKLLGDILAEAARLGKQATIYVESFNRARGLYERLGFKKIASNGVYNLMKWLPNSEENFLR